MSNNKLVKIKLKSDPSCEWCSAENQNILHLFWDCHTINKIWYDISKWLTDQLGCLLVIERELVFLHDIEAGNLTTIINLVILIVSRYIYIYATV